MLKLTFSLTSLVILLMVAFCLPVAAGIVLLPQFGDNNEFFRQGNLIPPGGFAVFGVSEFAYITGIIGGDVRYGQMDNENRPDLETFFRLGGTVDLVMTYNPDADPNTDGNQPRGVDADADTPGIQAPAAKSLVISEIMWGVDIEQFTIEEGETVLFYSPYKQWIEIYNTTDKTIDINKSTNGDIDGIYLVFNAYTTASGDKWAPTDIVSDTVSNLYRGKWRMPGQSGVTQLIDRFNIPQQSDIVSAYRKIDYERVTGVHKSNPDENREEQLKGIPDGRLSGSWAATPVDGSRNMYRWHVGTPGTQHVKDTAFTFDIPVTSIPSNSVVINEVRNDNSRANLDWVELYNVSTEAVGLWDWELTLIEDSKAPNETDTVLVGWDKPAANRDETGFPRNEDFKLQPGEYLLIVNRHPRYTPLANGVDIDAVIGGTHVNSGATHQFIVRPGLDLPNGRITLLLRSAIDKNVQHEYPRKEEIAEARGSTDTSASSAIMDYAGDVSISVDSSEYNTDFWPFRGWNGEDSARGKDGENIPNSLGKSHARQRYQANDGHHKDAWEQVGTMGGLGYDGEVDLKIAPGTPGYANDAIRDRLIDDKNNTNATDDVIYNGEISISEIMYNAGPRWNLVQWIELYNSSMTEAVNIGDWEMEIRNATDEVESYVDSSFVFKSATILPNQTLLIVSGPGTNDVAPNRVYNLYEYHRRVLGLTSRRSVLLGPGGFYLKLIDKNGDDVDEAGNLVIEGVQRNVMWELPPRNPEYRQSVVRRYGPRALNGDGPDAVSDGTMETSWNQLDIAGAGLSYYGHRNDIGTPGFRLGGPLPVSLSSFRPVRNQATGHVGVTWITESELNNAGFNILRSESKNGEFEVINFKGIIAGHGTTSEQHVYRYTDTTAKPNVVYYYQIEDVSINGLRTTLTTTHLRGDVSAAGKVTTTWGNLKSQK